MLLMFAHSDASCNRQAYSVELADAALRMLSGAFQDMQQHARVSNGSVLSSIHHKACCFQAGSMPSVVLVARFCIYIGHASAQMSTEVLHDPTCRSASSNLNTGTEASLK